MYRLFSNVQSRIFVVLLLLLLAKIVFNAVRMREIHLNLGYVCGMFIFYLFIHIIIYTHISVLCYE